MVKNLPEMQDMQMQSLVWEDPLVKGMTTHSSILARRIPWTEDSGGLSPWDYKESDMTERPTLSLQGGCNQFSLEKIYLCYDEEITCLWARLHME